MIDMDEILEKYSESVIKNFDKRNMAKIILFLQGQHCDYIDELLEDYLDLFTFPYEEFVSKYNEINAKYNNKFLELASYDMNLLEEFYK